MSWNVRITAGELLLEAGLNDAPTAKAIVKALPIQGQARRWGGEIYFPIPVEAGLEDGAREVVEAGELGYWPTGSAFCIFFGATPASNGDEIRAASPVNIVGRVQGDLRPLWDVPDGAAVSIRLVSEGQ
jgi:hypothetical protein